MFSAGSSLGIEIRLFGFTYALLNSRLLLTGIEYGLSKLEKGVM